MRSVIVYIFEISKCDNFGQDLNNIYPKKVPGSCHSPLSEKKKKKVNGDFVHSGPFTKLEDYFFSTLILTRLKV